MNNPYVWIGIAVVIGIIVGLAIWFGRGLKIKKGSDGYSLEVEKNEPPDTSTDNVKVAEGIELRDVEAGDIAGRKVSSPEAAGTRPQNTEVASHAKIERTKLGDIVGIKQEGPPQPDKK